MDFGKFVKLKNGVLKPILICRLILMKILMLKKCLMLWLNIIKNLMFNLGYIFEYVFGKRHFDPSLVITEEKTALFRKLFEIILTDGGSEFSGREDLETASDGNRRTTVYYCDPYSFWQKGCCEKNHEYIRYVRKKGSSFEDLEQADADLLANHINSTKRDSLNGHSPFELSQLLLDEKLLTVMNYKAIAPDDVRLTPELLK